MPKRKQTKVSADTVRMRPATTPEEREMQLTQLAMDLVEQRLIDGTASASETVHFLKLASSREQLERRKLETDITLNKAKAREHGDIEETKKLMQQALSAMREYTSNDMEEG